VGAEVTISVDSTTLLDHTSYNVLGRVEGAGAGRVFVIAHYDSWHLSHSAFDNALGVGAMIQLAAQLAAGPQPEATVVFMATSGEEQGLQGAIAWVSENEDEAEDVDLVITLDALWSAAGTFWVTASDPDWIAAGLEAAAAEGIEAADGGDVSLASDHFPFVTRGVPAIWCTRWRDDHYHTERDTLDQLDMDQAAAAARSQWRLLAQAAGVPESD
jgi:Zn-dependent M28 family amino/carboxypeptidase